MNFILASASPRRLALLAQIGLVPVLVDPAECDETPQRNELPNVYARRIALLKAQTVAARHPSAVILAADTVVFCGRRILPKAGDEATARRCLARLSGRRHRVVTAVTLMKDDKLREKQVMTSVRFNRLDSAIAEAYIAGGEWKGKAGGYAIQGSAAAFIPAINGSYSNVVGLPLTEVNQMLLNAHSMG